VHLFRKLMDRVGVDRTRLRLEWVAASEGSRFAGVMDDFVRQLKELGPLHGDDASLPARLAAVDRLIPYIKLVERERLRAPDKTEDATNDFYASEETDRLFEELIGDKLVTSQILTLLGEKPLTTAEIAEALRLEPSAVSKHMNASSRQGLVRYDSDRTAYVLA